jgi:hypothetical protein
MKMTARESLFNEEEFIVLIESFGNAMHEEWRREVIVSKKDFFEAMAQDVAPSWGGLTDGKRMVLMWED